MYFASTGDAMPTTFTIKQIPEALAGRLRRRAAANHRSLQRELLLILEDAAESSGAATMGSMRVREPAAPAYLPAPAPTRRSRGIVDPGKLSLQELWQRARKLGARSHAESTDLIRRDRDARIGR
jgi:hypothetical protein